MQQKLGKILRFNTQARNEHKSMAIEESSFSSDEEFDEMKESEESDKPTDRPLKVNKKTEKKPINPLNKSVTFLKKETVRGQLAM